MSKFLCTSDWHIKENNPKFRIDNFTITQFDKISFIFKTARKHKAPILMGGDMFDSAKTPIWLILKYFKLIKHNKDISTYGIPGQHDLRYHNKKEYTNTPICILDHTGCITTFEKKPHQSNRVHIYGCWWEGKILKIKNKKAFNILIIHRMITNGKLEWYGQEDYTDAKRLLKKTGYDLIVSGDNHRPFITKYKKQTLINPGSIVRQKSNEMKAKPRIYIFDTESREVEKIYIPIEPAKKVFNIKGIQTQEQQKENVFLREFIDSINIQDDDSPNFIKLLAKVIKKAKPTKGTLKMVDMFMEKANAKT